MLRDAVQTDEGIRLCRSCYEQTGVSECWPDRAADRVVKSLLIRCPNYLSGCPWQGTLRNLEVNLSILNVHVYNL